MRHSVSVRNAGAPQLFVFSSTKTLKLAVSQFFSQHNQLTFLFRIVSKLVLLLVSVLSI